MTKLLIPTIFALVAIASLIFLPVNEAFAKSKFSAIAGSGNGEIRCPDGSVVNNVSFAFAAQQVDKKGPIVFAFAYALPDGSGASFTNPNGSGDLGKKKFSLQADTVTTVGCFVGGVSQFFTILTGTCNQNSVVTFGNGALMTGSFTADVVCA